MIKIYVIAKISPSNEVTYIAFHKNKEFAMQELRHCIANRSNLRDRFILKEEWLK